jgi:hypothetical protein
MVRNSSDEPHVFVRGTDGHLWHTWLTSIGGQWNAWEDLGGDLRSDPAVLPGPNGSLTVAVKGTDRALWTRQWQAPKWGPWLTVGGDWVDSKV